MMRNTKHKCPRLSTKHLVDSLKYIHHKESQVSVFACRERPSNRFRIHLGFILRLVLMKKSGDLKLVS